MNWYKKFYKLADMPLPSYVGVPEKRDRAVSEVYGLGGVEEGLSEEDAQKEQKRFKDLAYIGAGSFGTAYNAGSGKVAKYTTDSREYDAALQLLHAEENNPAIYSAVVRVYQAEKINADVYLLVTEKVQPLTKLEQPIVNQLHMYRKILARPDKVRHVKDAILSYLDDSYPESLIEQCMQKYIVLMKKLSDIGAAPNDAHGRNIGTRQNGDWVVLDVGGLFSNLEWVS